MRGVSRGRGERAGGEGAGWGESREGRKLGARGRGARWAIGE